MSKTTIQIKSIWGSVLFEHMSRDNTIKETLEKAIEERANLWGANLREANLWGANLSGANLWGAKNVPPLYADNLNLLRFQKGKLRAFKYLNGDESPIDDNKITYKVGKTIIEKDYDTSDLVLCSRGLNVATLEWCLREGNIGENTFIEVEFLAKDIIAIPYNTDGKFRVRKLKVIRKIPKAELKKYMERKIT